MYTKAVKFLFQIDSELFYIFKTFLMLLAQEVIPYQLLK